MDSPGFLVDSRTGAPQSNRSAAAFTSLDCRRILVTGCRVLVRVALHKNTDSAKLSDADNVKGGALAATHVCIRPAYCRETLSKQGEQPCFFLSEEPMASATDVRNFALSLPGTAEAPHFDRTAFKARRIYVTVAADGKTANLVLTPDEQEMKCLLLPEAFAPVPNKWGERGWTTVTLAAAGEADLRSAIEMAYAHARPKESRRP